MHIYKMNDYDFVATKQLDKQNVNDWYESEVDEENDINNVVECDLDSEGFFCEVSPEEYKFERLYPIEEIRGTYPTGKYTIIQVGEVCQHISFRDAIKRTGWAKDPFIIASVNE